MSDNQLYPYLWDGVTMLRGLYRYFYVHAPPATMTHTHAHTQPATSRLDWVSVARLDTVDVEREKKHYYLN